MKRALLGNRVFYRDILRLGVPIAVQNLLQSSLTMIDTIMIGQLGEMPLAAVGMAGQWSFLMFLFYFGFSSGGSVFFSQYWGSGNIQGIRRIYGLALVNMLLVGVVFTLTGYFAPRWVMALFTGETPVQEAGMAYLKIAVFAYIAQAIGTIASTLLRSTEEVRLPLFASLASVVSNTFLNWVMIFGKFGFPAMGVEGAALATAISAWINTGILLIVSWVRRNMASIPLRELFSFHWQTVRKFYPIAIPVVLNESLWAMGTMVLNMVYGRMGTGNYSALTIERTVENLIFVFFVGISSACTVMVGKRIGAGDIEEGKLDARRFGAVVPCLAVLLGLVLILVRGPLVNLFSLTPEVRGTAQTLLVIAGCIYPLRMFNYITVVGIFRAGGDTRTGMFYDLGCIWLISVPLVALTGLVLHWNFIVVFGLMYAEDLVKCVLGQRHLYSGRWIRPVTEGPAVKEG